MWNQRSDTMTADLGLPGNKRALSEHTNTQMTVSLKDSSKIQFETNHANIFIGPYCQFVWTRCPRDQALFWHITMQLGVTSGHWFLIYATVEVEKEELRIKMNCSDATTRPYNFDWMSGGCCSPSLGDSYGTDSEISADISECGVVTSANSATTYSSRYKWKVWWLKVTIKQQDWSCSLSVWGKKMLIIAYWLFWLEAQGALWVQGRSWQRLWVWKIGITSSSKGNIIPTGKGY